MEENYPELKTRLQSTGIDTILILITMFLISTILGKFENVPDEVRIIFFVIVFFIYEPLCITFGCTLGHLMTGIRVRRMSDNSRRINILQAVARHIVKVFLGLFSFLTMHSNDERRALHDLVSGSVMVNLKYLQSIEIEPVEDFAV